MTLMAAVVATENHHIPKYIYNHDIMNCTAEGVVGNYLYSGRALGMTEPDDLIQLHDDLKPLWPEITAHYDRIGLSYTRDVLWYLDLQQLGLHIGYQPSVFFFGPDEFANWGDDAWYNAVAFINSKNSFMALADELGVAVPKTLCFDSKTEITPTAISEMRFPCYLKAAISVSGVGIYHCDDETELMVNLANFTDDIPLQVQAEVKTDLFLNLQYVVEDNELFRLTASEQILDGCVHQGNRVPARYEPWETVEPMAIWLQEHGMKGIFAFDVAVVETDTGVEYLAIECNPRFNGASYPTRIAQKLGIPEWSAKTYSTSLRELEELDLDGIEYDQQTGEGAVLVNWGTILEGKLMILLAGSQDYQDALDIELQARL